MTRLIGRFVWVIPEGYIPSKSHGPAHEMTSHETACLLNTGDRPAHVRITIFYADREPVRPYELVIPPRRTLHLRFNDSHGPGAHPARHRLFERHRIGRPDCRPAHAPRLAPGGRGAALHGGLFAVRPAGDRRSV